MTDLVFGHAADARMDRLIETVATNDEKIKAVLPRVLGQGFGGPVRLDSFRAESTGSAEVLHVDIHPCESTEAAASRVVAGIVDRFGVGGAIEHCEDYDPSIQLVCKIRGRAERAPSVRRTIPANEEPTEV